MGFPKGRNAILPFGRRPRGFTPRRRNQIRKQSRPLAAELLNMSLNCSAAFWYHASLARETKIIVILKKLFKHSKKKHQPLIVPRSEHNISRADISPSAIKVLYRLKKGGFDGYLVGGSVRDLLVGHKPKDFDIATNAHPEQIYRLFRNAILIGRRFRLAHIRFGREIIEVATFRSQPADARHHKLSEHGMVMRDNIYGSLEDDAWRRDFTINALYYNISDFSVVDYTGGLADLERRMVTMIGDPVERYQEDPVRMLRAVRIAAKLDFTIEQNTAEPIHTMGGLLENVAGARLFDEAVKLFYCGRSLKMLSMLKEYDLLDKLFPQTQRELDKEKDGFFWRLILEACKNTDLRKARNETLNPAFLVALAALAS